MRRKSGKRKEKCLTWGVRVWYTTGVVCLWPTFFPSTGLAAFGNRPLWGGCAGSFVLFTLFAPFPPTRGRCVKSAALWRMQSCLSTKKPLNFPPVIFFVGEAVQYRCSSPVVCDKTFLTSHLEFESNEPQKNLTAAHRLWYNNYDEWWATFVKLTELSITPSLAKVRSHK